MVHLDVSQLIHYHREFDTHVGRGPMNMNQNNTRLSFVIFYQFNGSLNVTYVKYLAFNSFCCVPMKGRDQTLLLIKIYRSSLLARKGRNDCMWERETERRRTQNDIIDTVWRHIFIHTPRCDRHIQSPASLCFFDAADQGHSSTQANASALIDSFSWQTPSPVGVETFVVIYYPDATHFFLANSRVSFPQSLCLHRYTSCLQNV